MARLRHSLYIWRSLSPAMGRALLWKRCTSTRLRTLHPHPLRGSTSNSTAYRGPDHNAFAGSRLVSTKAEHLPRIVQPSIWQSVIPRALRSRQQRPSRSEEKPHNPATYFIWIYLFIGSQAIRVIGVQNEFDTFMRRADLQIEKLRRVIEALQKGEPINVEKILGTGDEPQELELEAALKEIEIEDQLWQSNKKRRREAKAQERAENGDASPINETIDKLVNVTDHTNMEHQPGRPAPGFY